MTRPTHPPRPDEDRREFSEEAASLWRITFAPVVWAGHFVLCYGIVSLACIRGLMPIAATRAGLVAISVAALVAIGWLGWRSFRQWDTAPDRAANVGETEGRHAFLGHAAFLLSIISAIGVVFVTLPLLLIGDCR
ncbi:hypothetical protein HKCCE2091_08690 [Rhodobacterales bacterium HKCCE2091]|nr:hypothetical protein [Rhodobacterales bacterium HKCCE2091]